MLYLNIRISSDGIIKVADFGLSEDIYETEYFQQLSNQNIKLPIKWMALESIYYKKFTEKTDVVSYPSTVMSVLLMYLLSLL